MVGQGDRVFNCRIAGTDDDDFFDLVFVRVVELILHPVPIVARHAHLSQVALQADRQDDIIGLDGFAAAQGQFEPALRTLNRRHLRFHADVDAKVSGLVVPSS